MSAPLPAWITYLGRLGQFAKGLVYISIGLLAAEVAWAGHGQARGSRGAMRAIAEQPFGRALLVVLIGGLICYILWRLLEVFFDVEHRGRDAKGIALRARSLVVAFIYGGLTLGAIKTLLGASSRGGGDGAARDWTARAMAQPFGATLVVLIGAAIIAGGLYKIWRAYSGKFEKKLQLGELSARARKWILRICVFGLSARGVVFVIVGAFLFQAGLQSNPQKARGLTGALEALQTQPYGRWLFAIVGLGLAAYGIYSGVRGRYGRWESA
ncbi:MAG: DUF1206 domain-containing protein [Chthoniobacterales bacterium]